jgi:uncharacterized protein (DUF1800 family)
VNITINVADPDMPEGAAGTHELNTTVEANSTKNIGDIGFTFGDQLSIDPAAIAQCDNPVSFTWEGSTVAGSSQTVWTDMKNNRIKEVDIDGYRVTLTLSDVNSQFNNADAGTSNENNTTSDTNNSLIPKGVFGAPYLTLYLGDDNDKNSSTGSLAKGDKITLRVDFNESVILDNWLFRDIDSGDVRNSESGWDWQDALKINAYNKNHNPVELTVQLSETTNLQSVNGVVRTQDTITSGAGTDTTDPKGHARWSSNGKAVKYMIVEFSSGSAVNFPTRSAVAASGFAFCPVTISTAPTLTTVPETTVQDSLDVEVNGLVGASIYVNGEDTNQTIGGTGVQTITLPTAGGAGTKTFEIQLELNGVFSQTLTVTVEKTVVSTLPSRRDALKFLRQASFRSTEADISYVMQNGYEAWIDNQFAMTDPFESQEDQYRGYLETTLKRMNSYNPNTYPAEVITDPTELNETIQEGQRMDVFRNSTFWEKALDSDDQLRQRIAYALSQIIVLSDVSPAGQAITFRGESPIQYYDILYKHSFGNYRELLTDVTHSTAMGYFMTYIGSSKNAPDENYARELTQLFTVGLYELDLDGTIQRDGNGKAIPSYDQQHVTDLSKVFTGWELDDLQGEAPSRFGGVSKSNFSWTSPLKFRASEHDDNSTLDLIGDATMNTSADGTQDIENALDILFANRNVAPHIARHLIMRLVTSNPTPAYIERVATVFNDNGNSVKGDLKAVVKAILLDDEARGRSNVTNFGKVDEMLVAYGHFMSLFKVRPSPRMTMRVRISKGVYESVDETDIYWINPEREFGQSPLGAPDVFNFYSNEFIPSSNYFATNKLVSPEIQIQNSPNLIGFSNLVEQMLVNKEKYSVIDLNNLQRGEVVYEDIDAWANGALISQANEALYLDLTEEYNVFEKALDNETTANGDFTSFPSGTGGNEAQTRAINALFDHLNNKLFGGAMSEAYKEEIVSHAQSLDYNTNDRNRPARVRAIVVTMVRAMVTSSQFMVLK